MSAAGHARSVLSQRPDARSAGRPAGAAVTVHLADATGAPSPSRWLITKLHDYLRESRVPVLAVWGRGDEIFGPDGARAFATDAPDAVLFALTSTFLTGQTLHIDGGEPLT